MAELREIAYRLDPALWVQQVLGVEPTPWQAQLLRAPRGASLLALTARQCGKTTTAAWAMAHAAVFGPGSLSVVACPAQRQSAEAVRRVREAVTKAGAKLTTANVYGIELDNGARVLALPGSDNSIRGLTVDAWIVADEAARLSADLIAALRPMRARRPATRFAMLSTAWSRTDPFWAAWDRTAMIPRGSGSKPLQTPFTTTRIFLSKSAAPSARTGSSANTSASHWAHRPVPSPGSSTSLRRRLMPRGCRPGRRLRRRRGIRRAHPQSVRSDDLTSALESAMSNDCPAFHPDKPQTWPRFAPLMIAHDVGRSRDRSTAVVGGNRPFEPRLLGIREFEELPQGLYGTVRASALAAVDRRHGHNAIIIADLSNDATYAEVLQECFGTRVIGLQIGRHGDGMTVEHRPVRDGTIAIYNVGRSYLLELFHSELQQGVVRMIDNDMSRKAYDQLVRLETEMRESGIVYQCPPGQHDDLGISCAMLAWAARHPHRQHWCDSLFPRRRAAPRQTFGWEAFT